MNCVDLTPIVANVILWCGIVAIFFSFFYCPLWVSLLLVLVVFWLNNHYECYAYKSLWSSGNGICKESYKLISYNVNLAYKDNSNYGPTEGIANYLLECNADIVLLQEYDSYMFPELHNKLVGRYTYSCPYDYTGKFKAVYSKYPINEYVQFEENDCPHKRRENLMDRKYLPICGMAIAIGKKKVYVVNCHLQSNNFSQVLKSFKHQEMSIWKFLKIATQKIIIGMRTRERQVSLLRQHISEKDIPTIICGDMNDVSGSKTLNILQGRTMRDAWWDKGLGQGSTLMILGMRFRLDHILYSKGIEIEDLYVGSARLSDHYPLVCTFHIK